jgi:MoaA/NifB/PqqE/SkfB family radical SAM enzyme
MRTATAGTALVPSAFLHIGPDRIYHPLTDRTLHAGEAGHAALLALLSPAAPSAALAPAMVDNLARDGWLVEEGTDESVRYYLKYASLEAHTVCNQACYFCPVSVAPRQAHFMPDALYEQIVAQLAPYRDTLEAVFMISYNEPTVDRRFVDQVRLIKSYGLPPATLTNATGLTPERIDALVAMGGLRYLSVNLSTLDASRYDRDRGGDHLGMVLDHLDYAASRPVAEEMDIVVLGTGDAVHRNDFAAISERFAGSRFRVRFFEVMDRAGYLAVGLKPSPGHRRLCGCENIGSRPLQHLHITPHGRCVLCCEDYDEKYLVGDLTRETVSEVLGGPQLQRMRRWAYGIERAPDDFLCRRCVFARTES